MARTRVVSLSELEDIRKCLEYENTVKVPDGVSQKSFAQSLRNFLSVGGEVPTICKIGEDELYVRLIGE